MRIHGNYNYIFASALAVKVNKYIEEEVKAVIWCPLLVWVSVHRVYSKEESVWEVVNLCFPSGQSINNAISAAHSSFQYVTVHQVAELILQCSIIAKTDLKAAFRRVPVCSANQHYLRISWRIHTFCDRALSFSLRSTTVIFNAMADGLSWVRICCNKVNLSHYLDDFIFWSTNHGTCKETL